MSVNDHYENTKMSSSGVLAPLVTLAALVVFWQLGQKWIAIPAVFALLCYYLLLPKIVRSKANKFHRDAIKLLALGKAEQIPILAKRQLILQLFAPSAPLDAKLGLAYVQIGKFGASIGSLENALTSAPEHEKPALRSGLAKALFVTGDPARAEVEGRTVIDKGTKIPELLAIVARSRIGLGKIDKLTFSYLAEAKKLSSNNDTKLMLDLTEIEVNILAGKKYQEIPEGADSDQRFLRIWIYFVRGKIRELKADDDGAAKNYTKAIKEGEKENCWFANLAHQRLQNISSRLAVPTDDESLIDPAMRRKKKKRR